MKTLKLPTGETVKFDDEDWELVMQYKWHRTSSKQPYAIATIPSGSKKIPARCILMHRLIMQAPEGLEVDHLRGNGCDNRKKYLRIKTKSQNLRSHVRKIAGTTSRYRGVSKHGKSAGWVAVISGRLPGQKKGMYIGYFKTEREAALAWNAAAPAHGYTKEALNRVA